MQTIVPDYLHGDAIPADAMGPGVEFLGCAPPCLGTNEPHCRNHSTSMRGSRRMDPRTRGRI
jgi:hypothetical protein